MAPKNPMAPPKYVPAPMAPAMPAMPKRDTSSNLGKYLHPKKESSPAVAPMKPMSTAKPSIGPNTTAPAKARSVTAMSNGAFPIGDKKRQILAQQMAPKSYNAGNITKGQEVAIIAKARSMSGRGK